MTQNLTPHSDSERSSSASDSGHFVGSPVERFYCKLCDIQCTSVESYQTHTGGSKHCKKFLCKQNDLGFKEFGRLFGDVPFSKRCNIPPPPSSEPYTLHVYRSGLYHKYTCRACDEKTFHILKWYEHIFGWKHGEKMQSLQESMNRALFMSQYGDLPGPNPKLFPEARGNYQEYPGAKPMTPDMRMMMMMPQPGASEGCWSPDNDVKSRLLAPPQGVMRHPGLPVDDVTGVQWPPQEQRAHKAPAYHPYAQQSMDDDRHHRHRPDSTERRRRSRDVPSDNVRHHKTKPQEPENDVIPKDVSFLKMLDFEGGDDVLRNTLYEFVTDLVKRQPVKPNAEPDERLFARLSPEDQTHVWHIHNITKEDSVARCYGAVRFLYAIDPEMLVAVSRFSQEDVQRQQMTC